MQHNAPHRGAAFEGYYNKFSLPSGAHLVLVVCKVKDAKEKANCVSLTYVPRDGSKTFQREVFPERMEMHSLNGRHAFMLDAPSLGHVKWNADSTVEYNIEHEDFSFHATTSSRTPWSECSDTPEGFLARLPLPLHWHVHSLASQGDFTLNLPSCDFLAEVDAAGKATVHQEKNWGYSFPSAHIWIQARNGERGICCAGGRILGLSAFLSGYRSKDLNVDFRPPFAMRVWDVPLFLDHTIDWPSRSVRLRLDSFMQRVCISASAPSGSFFSLSPPFPEGHRQNFLGQSFEADVDVKIYQRTWTGSWRLIREDHFKDASLEFGGDYYGAAGSEKKIN